METSNEISIRADWRTVFDLAARTEDWARILPHYRYVRLLHSEGNRKWVRMSAWRDFVPVTWTAIQTVEQGKDGAPGRVKFRHIRGMVRGMEVEWRFTPRPERGDVLVGIYHSMDNPPWPTRILAWGPPGLMEKVVGRGFIGYIAGKTLRRMKELAEAHPGDRNLGDRVGRPPHP